MISLDSLFGVRYVCAVGEPAATAADWYPAEDYARSFANVVDLNASLARENVPCRQNMPRTYLAVGRTRDDEDDATAADRSSDRGGRTVGYSVFKLPTVVNGVETLPQMYLAVEKTRGASVARTVAYFRSWSRRRDETADRPASGGFPDVDAGGIVVPEPADGGTSPMSRADATVPDSSTGDLRRADDTERRTVAAVPEKAVVCERAALFGIVPRPTAMSFDLKVNVFDVNSAFPLWSKVKRLFFIANARVPLVEGGRAGDFFKLFLNICNQTLNGRERERLSVLKNPTVSANYTRELMIQSYPILRRMNNRNIEYSCERKILKTINHQADVINSEIFGMFEAIDMHYNSGVVSSGDSVYFPSQILNTQTLSGTLLY